MLHYFRSAAYKVEELYAKWIEIAGKRVELVRIGGRVLTLGDHIKIGKEGRRMPGVTTHHQESDNSSKAEYIEGHIFAHVSAVATKGEVSRSIPLMSERQESPPRKEGSSKPDGDTLVTQMVNLAIRTAKCLAEPCVTALDAYFAKGSAFEAAAAAVSESGEQLVEIVTRAPTDTVGFTVPAPPPKPKRGQPPKYGDKIGLYSLFGDMSKFTETTMILYGKQTKVKYHCIDLIWKPVWKPLNRLIRFVAVELNGSDRCVLMASCLSLTPQEIISVYALRFKIESSFDEQKNDMACFSYHFGTTALPKRKKWNKAELPSDDDVDSIKKVNQTKRAIDSFVCIGTIATGILTIIGFSYDREIWSRFPGWLRSLRSSIPSIAVIKETIAHAFPPFLSRRNDLDICSFANFYLKSFDFDDFDVIA